MSNEGLKELKLINEELVREKTRLTNKPTARKFDHDGDTYESRAWYDADGELKCQTMKQGKLI